MPQERRTAELRPCARPSCPNRVKRAGKRFCSCQCWALVMNASWSFERKHARAVKGGYASWTLKRQDQRAPWSASSRLQ